MTDGRTLPPLRVRAAGKAVASLVAFAPPTWSVLRRPVEKFFDSAALSWESRTGAGGYEHLEALAVALDQIDIRPERVLDLGCGTGEGTLFLAREFPTAGVRGIDISAEMIRRASRKLGLDPSARVSYRVADASSLPWPPDSFDLVTQINLPVFSAEVARVLRPGGCFISTSSLGRSTPFHTPDRLYELVIRRAGMVPMSSGLAGVGSWRIARLPTDG